MEKMPFRDKIIIGGLSASILAGTIYAGEQIKKTREDTKAKVLFCLEHKEDTKCSDILKSIEGKKIVVDVIEKNYGEEKGFSDKINDALYDIKEQIQEDLEKPQDIPEERDPLEIEETKARTAGEPARLCNNESNEFCEEDGF